MKHYFVRLLVMSLLLEDIANIEFGMLNQKISKHCQLSLIKFIKQYIVREATFKSRYIISNSIKTFLISYCK